MENKFLPCLSARMTSFKLYATVLLLIVRPGMSIAGTPSYEEGIRQQCAVAYHSERDYEKCAMRGVRPPQINSFLDHDPAYRAQPFVSPNTSQSQ